MFQLVFCLIFHHKSWFTLFNSKKGDRYPAKDSVYRFMNHSKFAWRRFLTYFSVHTIQKVDQLTNVKRPKVLIVDDSMFDRNRSKKVNLCKRTFQLECIEYLFFYYLVAKTPLLYRQNLIVVLKSEWLDRLPTTRFLSIPFLRANYKKGFSGSCCSFNHPSSFSVPCN